MDKRIKLVKGDITKLKVDAIVNAANCSLLGGGGVDGAIHRAAGVELLNECKTLGGCKTGQAKITKGYNLSANYVIHTPGPVWHGGNSKENELLADCYKNCLAYVNDYQIHSIAFPAISTGVYHFPQERAAQIALNEITTFLNTNNTLNEVIICAFNSETYNIYNHQL